MLQRDPLNGNFQMRRQLASLLAWLMLCNPLLAGGVPPPSMNAQQSEPDLADAARITRGKSTFDSTCAAFCHGLEPPLFIGRKGLDPDSAFTTIAEGGRGATPMPPWGDVFTRDEIWDLVAYIVFLGKQTTGQSLAPHQSDK
jgi:mono/diheme cytochrome c family protein